MDFLLAQEALEIPLRAELALWALTTLIGAAVVFLYGIKGQTKDLWEVHLGANARDADGAPKWYTKQSFEDQVEKLAGAVIGLEKALSVMAANQKAMQDQAKRNHNDQMKTLEELKQ